MAATASSPGMADLPRPRKLGLATVPVIELSHLSERDKRALILADNKLGERAGWDKDLLALEAGDLRDMGVELGDLGFTAGLCSTTQRGARRCLTPSLAPAPP